MGRIVDCQHSDVGVGHAGQSAGVRHGVGEDVRPIEVKRGRVDQFAVDQGHGRTGRRDGDRSDLDAVAVGIDVVEEHRNRDGTVLVGDGAVVGGDGCIVDGIDRHADGDVVDAVAPVGDAHNKDVVAGEVGRRHVGEGGAGLGCVDLGDAVGRCGLNAPTERVCIRICGGELEREGAGSAVFIDGGGRHGALGDLRRSIARLGRAGDGLFRGGGRVRGPIYPRGRICGCGRCLLLRHGHDHWWGRCVVVGGGCVAVVRCVHTFGRRRFCGGRGLRGQIQKRRLFAVTVVQIDCKRRGVDLFGHRFCRGVRICGGSRLIGCGDGIVHGARRGRRHDATWRVN